MEKTIYIIRGVPGSGKSTFASELASALGIEYYEADMWRMEDGVYVFSLEKMHWTHLMCQSAVRKQMRLGNSVIVSNTSTTEKELKPYIAMAEEYGYFVRSVVVENRMNTTDIHVVPADNIKRLEKNLKNSIKLVSDFYAD